MQDIPTRIEFDRGSLEISFEASVLVRDRWRNVFQENTIAAKINHEELRSAIIVVFPRNFLSKEHKTESIIASALFGAGMAYHAGVRVWDIS